MRFSGKAIGLLAALLASGCAGGASIGGIARSTAPPIGASPSSGPTTTPGGATTPTPSPAPGASASPSGATASTAASCASGATPAPLPVGGTVGTGSWIAAWGATLGTESFSSATPPPNSSVRDVIRPAIGGTALRIRVSNPDTANPLIVCAAYVATQMGTTGAALVTGSTRQITFGGNPGVTLPPNTDYVYSDPVPYAVTAHRNLAISLYLTAATTATASTPTWTSSYASAAGSGDQTRDETGTPFSTNLAGPIVSNSTAFLEGGAGYALTAVDVLTNEANGAVVVFGSSTFQGYETDFDMYDDVAEDLAQLITADITPGLRKAIVNEGIGGDALYEGLNRLQRDVFSQSGVAAVVLYDINDIGGGRTLAQIEADYKTAVGLAHAHGIKVFCPTWAPESTDLTAETSQEREQVNTFILNSGTCDDIVDWDAVVRDPTLPETYNPIYFSDSIHPNAAGHAALANAVPLNRWFTGYAFPPQNARNSRSKY